VNHDDGMSSDDELSSLEQANIAKIRQEVESQARQTLADVVDDFSTLSGVMSHLRGWKECYPDSYTDAYVSLCLPKVFMPLVRLQLLLWNPFGESGGDFANMEWHRTLATYSLKSEEGEADLAADPDRRLVAVVVEKVVVPKLTGMVRAAYDPLSSSQTKNVTKLIKAMIETYPTMRGESKQVREFLTTVRDRLKASVDADPYVPIGYAKQIAENPNGAHAAFSSRQFFVCLKLLANVIAWHGILGDRALATLALDTLLNKYLINSVGVNPDCNLGLQRCRRVLALLPPSWVGPNGAFRNELGRMAAYLAGVGKVARGLGTEGLREVTQLLKDVGYADMSEGVLTERSAAF